MVLCPDVTDNISAEHIREVGILGGNSTGTDTPLYCATAFSTDPVYLVYERTANSSNIIYFSKSNSGRYIYVYSVAPSTTIDGDYQIVASFTKEGKTVYYAGVAVRLTPENPSDLPYIYNDGTPQVVQEFLWDLLYNPSEIPITYIPISSILNGPAQAAIGDEVEVDVSFPDGYKLKDATQGSGITVYNDNGYIDFTYDEASHKLRFTMPE